MRLPILFRFRASTAEIDGFGFRAFAAMIKAFGPSHDDLFVVEPFIAASFDSTEHDSMRDPGTILSEIPRKPLRSIAGVRYLEGMDTLPLGIGEVSLPLICIFAGVIKVCRGNTEVPINDELLENLLSTAAVSFRHCRSLFFG